VAILADRDGLWQWQYLLASICGMDPTVGLVDTAQSVSFAAWESGRHQPRTGRYRQRECPRSFWGAHTGPNPTDRAKAGCKRHVLTDADGIPLVVKTTPANTRDDQVALPLVVDMPPIAGTRGRPRIKPKALQGDAGYGSAALADLVKWLGIKPILAPLGKSRPHGSGLGKTRYVVERTLSWFGNFRRLKHCYERCGAHFQAFHELAAALLCANRYAKINTRF
jgi:transposase